MKEHEEVTKLLDAMEDIANEIRDIRNRFQNSIESKKGGIMSDGYPDIEYDWGIEQDWGFNDEVEP